MKRVKLAGMKKYMKLVGNAISALSIIFVLSALFRTDFNLTEVTDWRMFLTVCGFGVILKTFTVYLSGSAWCRLLEFFSGKCCSRREALHVYARANIGKYLPGNVMHYVERNLFAAKLELTQKQIAAASILEVVSLVMAAFCVGVFLSYTQMREVLGVIVIRLPVLRWIFAASGVILVAAVFWAVVWLYQHRKRNIDKGGIEKIQYLKKAVIISFGKTFFICFVVYATVLVILGIILVLVYWYWAGRPTAEMAVQMVSAYIIAWVLGFVIPGAPGGIGVRELALTMLLAPVVGEDLIVALGILHRLITVIGDFAAYLLRRLF